jgi:hypothetical protein
VLPGAHWLLVTPLSHKNPGSALESMVNIIHKIMLYTHMYLAFYLCQRCMNYKLGVKVCLREEVIACEVQFCRILQRKPDKN